ncbi:hypothetical protein [Phascolarctid gammaherpesvirus 1]|uniref:Uncharacterized protein n=1 Tax=Phascolarctid gammaherpesvirus 1 TaxID=2249313 RepID=A0A3S8D7R6_9GAMA|nr:hypothetical protein KM711_gp75 [Phascolarctid gammaherpesvirus 1]AZB49251.1 hypothetical protein [Phascolarctid gammaherpesvirus 1]
MDESENKSNSAPDSENDLDVDGWWGHNNKPKNPINRPDPDPEPDYWNDFRQDKEKKGTHPSTGPPPVPPPRGPRRGPLPDYPGDDYMKLFWQSKGDSKGRQRRPRKRGGGACLGLICFLLLTLILAYVWLLLEGEYFYVGCTDSNDPLNVLTPVSVF